MRFGSRFADEASAPPPALSWPQPGRSQAFDQVSRIACITMGTVTSCHLLTTIPILRSSAAWDQASYE